MERFRVGFTLIEVMIIISILGILAAIVVVGWNGWRHRVDDSSVRNDLIHATSGLASYQNFKNDYPPNLGGIDFAASPNVALKLSTNATQVRVYSSLSPSENAQLFLNTCNANMPIKSGATVYNTSCTFAGQNIHVKGTGSSNVVWQGPTINQADVTLTCGSACNTATSTLISEFLAQGGSFPISVPKNTVPLPSYDLASDGPATRFCLEAVSATSDDIVYHTSSENKEITAGSCPIDPELHYP
jgi:type II secretory pathway pseudopilin PulG